MSKKVAVIRKEQFNAAHRLFNPDWDDAKNTAVFGKCALPNYHGHNYDLEVRLTGKPDKKTGYVMDLKELSDLIKEEIINRFDHKNLNLDTKEFKELKKRYDVKIDVALELRSFADNFFNFVNQGRIVEAT